MEELVSVTRAYHFAAERHRDQRRKGAAAEPYINHLAEVAELVARADDVDGYGFGAELVIAAVLHDVVEDTQTTNDEVSLRFGDRVAAFVAEVTDDKSLPKAERKRLQVEHAAGASMKARMIKLADKTSNLRALVASPPADWPQERREQYLSWARQVVDGCRGASAWLEGQFDAAANALWLSLQPAECACEELARGLAQEREVGRDETEGRFADVTLWRCPTCRRAWVRYQVEYEVFTASGRWAMCLLDPQAEGNVTPETAPEFIDRAPWHI